MLHELCTKTIGHIEVQLANQKASDEAEATKMKEDLKRIDKMAWLESEQEEKEKADALKLMKEEEEENIKAAECELECKKKVLRDAQKAAELLVDNVVDEDEEDRDEVSVSTIGEHVSNLWDVRVYSILTIDIH